jgi:hypothetical protein
VFLFDEVQFLETAAFEALIAALHRTVQRALPVTLVGAGLPQMPRLAGEAKSYAERLFTFPEIGSLPQPAAIDALRRPAQALGVDYRADALRAIVDYAEGYPYFLQEYGKVAWDGAARSPITLAAVRNVQPLVEATLDTSFFRVRAERTTTLELRYLRAMAELGPGPQRAGDVAHVLGRSSVPHFDRYMTRNHPLVPPPKQ